MDNRFHSRIETYKKIKKELNKSINKVATIRLLDFILIIFMGYKFIDKATNYYLYLLILAMGILIYLIIYHNKLKKNLKFTEGLILINNSYLDRINENWINFSDSGEDFIDKTHPYSSDLDIVGKSSLFQRINLAHNFIGRQSLASDLLNTKYNQDEILKRQNAIEELGSKLDFIQKFEYTSMNTKNKDPEDLLLYFENESAFTYSNNFRLLIKFLPLLTLSALVVFFILQISSLFVIPFLLITLQIFLWLMGLKKNDAVLEKVGLFKNNLEVYVGLLQTIETENFESSLLKSEKDCLFTGEGAIKAIKKLDMISEKINIKHSGVLYLILNIFLLWDYRSVFALENWKKNYGVEVRKWIDSIGKIQSLTSLSVLLQVEENISYPIIEAGKDIIAKDCGHPLIQVEERVNNNISIKNNILIITGSNMSGKTTFLRTIGINLVLLNAGTVTISQEFIAPIINIYTSMRISDDLKNKISTFYAELLRIKKILDFGEDNPNTLFLIDEIFNGTNSKDRILGAKNVLLNLNRSGLIGAITTHDFDLCELDKYDRIENYHFAEDYVEGKISFDYKLKKGRSTSTNAKYLMELVGIEFME